MAEKTFADEVVAHAAKLAGFARRLAGRRQVVDDMVQETILRALLHSDQFKPGTNLQAWLCTILRNCYFNELRQGHRLSALTDAINPDCNGAIDAGQVWTVELKELGAHFAELPRVQQEALNLVAVEGNSYEEAAGMAGCALGTMKSRVSRARTALSQAIETEDALNSRSKNNSFFRSDLEHLDNAA